MRIHGTMIAANEAEYAGVKYYKFREENERGVEKGTKNAKRIFPLPITGASTLT